MPEFDNRWRPEPHPHRAGEWLVVRYRHDAGVPVRTVSTFRVGGLAKPELFDSEDAAQQHADTLNPVPVPSGPPPLTRSQLAWLDRLSRSPEGVMEASTHNTLLSLEFRGLVSSRAEQGYAGRDRWTITAAGRDLLARKGESR